MDPNQPNSNRRQIIMISLSALALLAAFAGFMGDGNGNGGLFDIFRNAKRAVTVADAPKAALPDSQVVYVSPAEFKLQVQHGAKPLDVRTPKEYQAGHLEGAVLLDYWASDFEEAAAKLDTTQTYAIYCKSGGRSKQAAAVMAKLGFRKLYVLVDAGYEAVK